MPQPITRAAGARFGRDRRGAAAVEFALWAVALTVPALSALDLGMFAVRRMQVEQAGHAGAAAAWRLCDTAEKLPATQNCPGLSAAVTTAVQSTPLGAQVSVAAGSPNEGYYCAGDDSVLRPVGFSWAMGETPPPKPANCSAVVTDSATPPSDYIQVTVTYDYAPMFGVASVASLLPTAITKTAWRRLS